MSTDYLGVYESFIHKSRYARYLPEKKRREHWAETIQRYCDFVLADADEHTSKTLYDAMIAMKIMPSMRALMSAGKAAERDNTALYNCLGGETLVTTKEYGIQPISTLAGKEVHIVDGNGVWTKAKCKHYGKQQLYAVNFATSGKGSFTIHATANHRWIDKNGKEWFTSNLNSDVSCATISMPERPPINFDNDYRLGVQHGIVYGDGTGVYSEKHCNGFVIRLCGTSIPLKECFSEYPCSFPPSYNGDPVIYITNRAIDLKLLPNTEFVSDSYLVGFIRGLMAADGSVTIGGQVTLSGSKLTSDWIMRHGPRLGFVPRRNYINNRPTNFGERKSPLYTLEFDRRYLQSDDFILEYKRKRFSPIVKNSGFGKIESIELSRVDDVYCFEVPTTQSFMLTRNLLTGNCSYIAIDDPKAFDEMMVILMNGTGVGFSVERQYINQLPEVPDKLYDSDTTIIVKDSKEGWGKALRQLIALLYTGEIPKWDTSKLRKAGARLKTFGGRSSGPEPLEELFRFVVRIFRQAIGRRLTSLECHDIACKIGEVVVVGGVRRSALISLSNLSDDRMRHAKSGAWWEANPQRSLSNNSAVYTEKPETGPFLTEWLSLYESKSGERGIINREAMTEKVRQLGRRDPDHAFGVNPCGEIILRPNQFCNLTEVIVRGDDTLETLTEKVRLATILGTFQSRFTYFPYLRKVWTKNTEEERLLGVSLTGIYDNKLINNPNSKTVKGILDELRREAIETNRVWAEKLNIPQSAAITCVKPSGTVSELTDTSSGIHPRHAKYYIRRVRSDLKDPLTKFLQDAGVPWEPDVMRPHSTVVFSFVKKAPSGALTKDDVSAIDHLKLWMIFQQTYCEHNPSVTVSIKENEWMSVGAFVYENFDAMTGVSFLPYDGGVYKQAPYEEITKDQYDEMMSKFPKELNWDSLNEVEDSTEGQQQLACISGGCEI